MPIDFYSSHLSPPCRAIILLAKNIGVELNIKPLNIVQMEQNKPEFLKINPQHCIPTIVDNGPALWESRAILAYLVEQYGNNDSLYPKDPKKRAIINQRLYFDIGTLVARGREYTMGFRNETGPTAESIEKLSEALRFLDTFLEGQDWVAGSNITIADYSIVVNVALVEFLGFDLQKYQNILKWLAKAKTTIKGYNEIQDSGHEGMKKFFTPHSH